MWRASIRGPLSRLGGACVAVATTTSVVPTSSAEQAPPGPAAAGANVFGVTSRNFRDLQPDNTGPRFLHSMLRVQSLTKTLAFFSVLDLVETRRTEVPSSGFTLVFLATAPGEPEIELTWNWGGEDASRMAPARNFGHLAFAVDDIYKTCAAFEAHGVAILRPPKDGALAAGSRGWREARVAALPLGSAAMVARRGHCTS